MNPNKTPFQVLRLAREEGCNTSADIADALKIPLGHASAYVHDLVKAGWLRRTGNIISNGNPNNQGRKYLCFEVVQPITEQAAE